MNSSNASLPSYAQHRERFLAAARAASAKVQEFPHPLRGPNGEALACDVALVGDPKARRMMVLLGGTHGVEGYYGSQCQSQWLEEFGSTPLPDDVAVLMIHTINPWGCAWMRRVNENNIDLNRNYLDYTAPLPDNSGYDALHAVYTCADLDGPVRANADRLMAEHIEQLGWTGYMAIVGAGQYQHSDGLFYGGQQPTWSNRTLRAIARQYLSHAEKVIGFDLHSGDGDFGNAMLIAIAQQPYPALEPARQLYGPWLHSIFTGSDTESSTGVVATATGYGSQALLDALSSVQLTQLVIECGTHDGARVHKALRDDHWLHLHGDLLDAVGQGIKRELVECFYPADRDWLPLVSFRSRQIFQRALGYLQG